MKKKLRLLAAMLVAALAVTLATPAMTAWAGDSIENPAEVDLVNDEPHELAGGGSKYSSPAGSGILNNSAMVVRGGISTATNLKNNQIRDSRGYISANSYHVAIVPRSNPLSDADANALSNVFSQQTNTWR
ncbi:MAG: hypothetical protein IJ274_00610 [Lachnospiraceae bacterium]|nr:hypothetical protein [Lachnospiraceae bacterium]